LLTHRLSGIEQDIRLSRAIIRRDRLFFANRMKHASGAFSGQEKAAAPG